MCDKCSEIDRKIAHYKDIAASILDGLLTERIEAMIAELLAAKNCFTRPSKSKTA
jgi:hypothetical protein